MKADPIVPESTASSRPREWSAPGLAWTEILVAELSNRLTGLVTEMRSLTKTDPLLKAMVISDEEVDGLLSSSAEVQGPQFQAGSLMHHLVDVAPPGSVARLLAVQQRFGLNGFEMDCLLVCLVAEIEPRFERVFGYLNDLVTARLPGHDILMRTVAPSDLAFQVCLGPDGRLARYGLLVSVDGGRFGPYRVAEGVVRYVLEQEGIDSALARAWGDADVPPLAQRLWDRCPELENLENLLQDALKSATADRVPLVIGLRGRPGSGRQYWVETACRRAGIGCIALDARKLRGSDVLRRTLTAAMRDTVMLGAAVLLHHADACLEDGQQLAELRAHLQPLVRELGWLLIFGSEGELNLPAWFPAARVVELEAPALSSAARELAWRLILEQIAAIPEPERASLATRLSVKFRLTHGEMALAAQRVMSLGTKPLTDADWSAALHRMAGAVAAPRLAKLAQVVRLSHRLEDIVLPPDRMELLRDVIRRVRHRGRVLEQWGLETLSYRGRGLVVLFHGASGTGKTMAAEAIARALEMQLFRIDLAGVVSKFIGETEKNLRALFDEADRADAVLFFDEADALFGKRSQVKDAHDRYANIEINYLLQRMELFDGIAILATNQRAHLDEAFLRRIHISVEFPLPQQHERREIWQRSFPVTAPLAPHLNWDFLAQRFELSGGAIHNAALGAAFLAADGNGVIGMPEILSAIRAEMVKAGKRVLEREFGANGSGLQGVGMAPRPEGLCADPLTA